MRRRGGRPRWGRPAAPPPPRERPRCGSVSMGSTTSWAARPWCAAGARCRGARRPPIRADGSGGSALRVRPRSLRRRLGARAARPRRRGCTARPRAGRRTPRRPCAGGGGLSPVGGSTAGAEEGRQRAGAHTGMRAGPRADRDSPRGGGLCARRAARRTRDAPPGRSPRTGRPSPATPLHGLGDALAAAERCPWARPEGSGSRFRGGPVRRAGRRTGSGAYRCPIAGLSVVVSPGKGADVAGGGARRRARG